MYMQLGWQHGQISGLWDHAMADVTDAKTNSITSIIAASSFPMDFQTQKAKLPSTITTVVFDIGARDSDYLYALEDSEDPSVALFLFDPLPDSNIPLSKRVAEYAMRDIQNNEDDDNGEHKQMDVVKSRQVFLAKVAVGEREGMANFNIARGAACSSILKTSDKNEFWCADVKETIQVPLVTLGGLLRLIPDQEDELETKHDEDESEDESESESEASVSSSSVEQLHIKIDAEGADLAVLKGGGDFIHRAQTIIIECNADAIQKTTKFRNGECVQSDAIQYMEEEQHFQTFVVESQGNLVNIMFVNPEYHGPLPKFLLHEDLEFHAFYRKLMTQRGWKNAAVTTGEEDEESDEEEE